MHTVKITSLIFLAVTQAGIRSFLPPSIQYLMGGFFDAFSRAEINLGVWHLAPCLVNPH